MERKNNLLFNFDEIYKVKLMLYLSIKILDQIGYFVRYLNKFIQSSKILSKHVNNLTSQVSDCFLQINLNGE